MAGEAIFLLRNCLTLQLLICILRTAFAWRAPTKLDAFDELMRITVQSVTNMEMDVPRREQTRLPVAKEEWLGLRGAAVVVPPVFLSPGRGTRDLVANLLSPAMKYTVDLEIYLATRALERLVPSKSLTRVQR